jgi:hypothetical protein
MEPLHYSKKKSVKSTMFITIIKLKIAFKCTHYTKGYERTKIISTIKKITK